MLVNGRLTVAAARRISARLRLPRRLGAASLGKLRVVPGGAGGSTTTTSGSSGGGGGTSGGGSTGGGGSGGGGGSAGGGGSSGGTCTGFTSKPITTEAPPVARPLGAVSVTAATIGWHVRDSWIRYVNTGEGSTPSGGAVAGPATVRPGTSTPLSYDFTFTSDLARSWFDPATGRVALYGAGAIRFAFTQHCIDLSTADPEVVHDGTAGDTVFRMFGQGVTDPGNKRGSFLSLGAATPTVNGQTRTYAQVPAEISEQGAAVLSDMYAPGNREFGWLTLSFTTG